MLITILTGLYNIYSPVLIGRVNNCIVTFVSTVYLMWYNSEIDLQESISQYEGRSSSPDSCLVILPTVIFTLYRTV